MAKNNAEIKAATIDELRQWYANAKKTYYECGGHNKAACNKSLMACYESELLRRETDVDAIAEGKFNGDGSY